ncbi:Nicotinamide/nicotinic acid mononucleotide adenylyltransferase 2 [Physocladia obscura]|uniref:Nicotinamide/nicotinic acid mononucleotide adenylyltransferase 2 n=1 Tax=Physocladia obscura TaxID=109957 RepID=A0AAD5SZX6_9FUNG|nr:Nicotinamide/nicotinic acid mononucleotide adenylyltransferase 2 [Physocladia obscura]
MESLAPTTKLLANLELLDPQTRRIKSLVVLVTTGAFCPIHNGHIEMLESAKSAIEANQSATVIAGFVSPTHDDYTSYKLDALNVTASHRLEMCRLATCESIWLDVDPWEARQRKFVDFPAVAKHLHEYLNERCPQIRALLGAGVNLRVAYVCGADHALKCSLRSLRDGGVAVVLRSSGKREQDQFLRATLEQMMLKQFGPKWWIKCCIADGKTEMLNVSSSQVRSLVLAQNRATFSLLCHPAVVQYFEENGFWQGSAN